MEKFKQRSNTEVYSAVDPGMPNIKDTALYQLIC